jgi:tRNA A37 threonylcarbamoyladenosine synthetase subunit TsaC/SUA5/YrdC
MTEIKGVRILPINNVPVVDLNPELIHEKWDKLVDIVIDGGYGDNVGSTVIDLTGDEPELIREGKGSLELM